MTYPETWTVVEGCTSHLTKAEAARLNAAEAHGFEAFDRECPVTCYLGGYGWMFYLGSDDPGYVTENVDPEEWPGLHALLTWCQANASRCRYVCLDADAEPIEGVPTHEW